MERGGRRNARALAGRLAAVCVTISRRGVSGGGGRGGAIQCYNRKNSQRLNL